MLRSPVHRYATALIILVVFSLAIGIQVYPAYSQENSGIIIPAGDSAALARAIEQANQAGTETPLNIYLQAGQYILYAPNEVDKPTLPIIAGALNLFGQNTLLLLYSETASPAQVTIALGARVELHRLQFLVASGTGRAIINHGSLSIYDSQFGSLDREVLPGVGEGGGIENYGDLSIERTNFARNQYRSTNIEGGAIYNGGNLTATCTRFVEGLASRGGAVFNTGNAIITKSAFKDNIANGGGAIFNEGGAVDASGNWWANSTPIVDSLYQGRDTISEDVAIMPISASDPTLDGNCDPDQPIIEPQAITSEQKNETNVIYNLNTGGVAASPIFISGYPSNATVNAITFCWNIDANFDVGDTPFWYTRARLSRDNPSPWESSNEYPSRTGDDEWVFDGYNHTSNECKTLNQPASGLPVNGTWWLTISTLEVTESGRIDWWSIQITYSVPFTVTGTTLLINNSTTPSDVNFNSRVNISGTITGTGTGTIQYQLEKALQGTANWGSYDGMIYTVQMTDGANVSLSHSNVLMIYVGTYDFRFRVITPSTPSQTNSTARLTIRGSAITPNTPTGTANGFTGTAYAYSTNDSKCQDGGPAEYQFNWGPTKSAWLNISQIPASYTWNTPGTYYVTVQARCKYYTSGLSGTSGALTVTMVEPFTVTGTTMLINGDTHPPSVPWGQSVTLGGFASGTGSGTVAYKWEWRYSGTSQWSFGGNSASTMNPATHTAPLGYTVSAPAIGDLEFRYWVTSPSSPNQTTATAFLTVTGTASQPATLTGETYVRVGQTYTYRTSGATCPDNGQVRYQFAYNLGSNIISQSWGNPVSSTTEVSDTYTWPVAGEYLEVWARAKCAYLNNGPESTFKQLVVKAVDIRSVTARINGSTSPGTVNYGNVTLSGTIDATGTGIVTYTWQFRRSGQTNWQILSTRTVNLNNSTPLTNELHQPIYIGNLEYRVVISSPAPDVVSNIINITVAASPTMPNRPSGPPGGDRGTSYLFSTGGSTCPNSLVEYQFDWGDNTSRSSWSTTASASHVWNDTGTFFITAWARCQDYPSG